MLELSLAVVGIDYLNDDRTNRRMELLYCAPGDVMELRREPKNKHDPHAVAVFSKRNIQVGYLTAERAPLIGARMANEEFEAVFQDLDTHAAFIRVRFGGGSPTLPAGRADHDPVEPSNDVSDSGFYPDPEGGEWGA